MKNPVIAALDIDDVTHAESLIAKLKDSVGGFKIGPRLTFKAEKSFFKTLSDSSLIFFFDHKFFDIPSTTVASVKAAFDLGATWVTVHGLNGPETLKSLASLEVELKARRPGFRILVVTVLTSFSKQTLPPIWKDEEIEQSVCSLAESAWRAGLQSFVCSSLEAEVLKRKFPESFLVVPGIRPSGSSLQDQSRVMTPSEALKKGASALVIGRPIIEAADPVQVVKEVLKTL